MEKLVAVDRNTNGEIISFKTSSGRVISYRKALQEIYDGNITGVQIIERNEEDLPIIQTVSNDNSFINYPPIF
ncbi:DUF3892 domain-containing protein [Caldibacillus lycopersici]|uniref:DUF3892 domain-containing protein n=1 Tax=Perspicuibacillus lycopersici TaxID=1325689 RepID=A0AAE3LN74_9BACI|nr:DUF3892 domain-containing protein [Perspicuibacillus lycopersici]MCU9613646.1 DUF3892 domain-containing protein [Perspicuibacillus lycopersici]